MNEFQGILVEVIFFTMRFVVPALMIYGFARIARRVSGDQG